MGLPERIIEDIDAADADETITLNVEMEVDVAETIERLNALRDTALETNGALETLDDTLDERPADYRTEVDENEIVTSPTREIRRSEGGAN